MKVIPALLMAALALPVLAADQEWKAYSYPDPGFSIQFPAPPSIDKSTVRTPAGMSLPMTRYSVKQEGSAYSVTVVDYSTTNAGEKNTIAEAEKSFGTTGKVTVAIDARVNRSFGRELSVTGANGSRSAVAIFFVNKHLYTLVGEALPPNAISRSGDSIRFQESLNFIGANGGFGGFGRFGGGRARGGGFNPQAQAACAGKAAGDAVQLDTPGGSVAATCTLVARPNMPPDGPPAPPPP